MKVLFIHDIQFVGGGELWALRAGLAFGRRGHSAEYLFPEGSPCHEAAKRRGLRSHGIAFGGPFDELAQSWRDLLDRVQPDAVLCSVMGFHCEAQILASVVGRAPTPALVLKSGTEPLLLPEHYGAGYEECLDGLLVVSPTLAKRFLKAGAPRRLLESMWEGVDLAPYREVGPIDARYDMRRKLGVAPDTPLILSVGRLDENKGHHELVAALGRLPADIPEYRCVVFGEGGRLRRLVAETRAAGLEGRVFFAGWHDRMPLYHSQADLLVHASRTEGLPNVVAEAFAAGTPVVATRVGGVADLVRDEVTGLTVGLDDIDALSHAIARMLTERPLREACGESARAFAHAELDSEKAVDELVAYLQRKVAARRTSGSRSRSASPTGTGP